MRVRAQLRETPSEVRRHPRVELHVEVTLESESNFYAGITNNVSEGGVFVATGVPPPVGAPVSLLIDLSGSGKRFALAGVVRWVREDEVCHGAAPGCGIQWLELPEDARRAFELFARSRDTVLFDLT